MPNNNFRPDQPEYYDSTRKLSILSNIIGGILNTVDEEETAQAFASEANYRAYATTCLPWEASDEEVIERITEIAPELKIDEAQREERRQLSEQARQAILDAAVRKVFGQKGRTLNDRLDAVFYQRGTAEETKEMNDKLDEKIKGTPEDRGRLLEERVRNSMELYQRILNGEVSKQELVENFEQIHMVQDLVTNAQNFLRGSEPNKDGKIYITFSPEIKDILVDMERHSTALNLFVNKIRIMANPNYEFLDLEQVLDLDKEKFEAIDDYATMESDDPIMEDALFISGTDRTIKKSLGRDNLMKQIAEDYPEEYEEAKLELVGADGKLYTMQYSTEHKIDTIEANVHKDCVLVTMPSGKAACYYLDNTNGEVEIVNSSAMLGKVTASADGVLSGLKQANKGFFIGSSEYSNAMKGMTEVSKRVKDVGDPPSIEKMDLATEQLQKVLAECEKYIERKRHDPKHPDRDFYEIRQEMSPREKNRYQAMEQTALYCRTQINLYALKQKEMAAEKNAKLGGMDPVKDLSELDALTKAHQTYGTNEIPATDVGNIADELRADINQSLSHMLTAKEFDKDEACETFSNMVLLEVVKRGRSFDEFTGDLVAGDLERTLAEKPESVVRAMRENPYVKAVTENMDLEMFRQLVTLDRPRHWQISLPMRQRSMRLKIRAKRSRSRMNRKFRSSRKPPRS